MQDLAKQSFKNSLNVQPMNSFNSLHQSYNQLPCCYYCFTVEYEIRYLHSYSLNCVYQTTRSYTTNSVGVVSYFIPYHKCLLIHTVQ